MLRLLRTLFLALVCLAGLCQLTVCAAGAFPSGETNTLRAISLPHFEPELPIAPGRDEFLTVCVSCHSPRYVTMQPLFPQGKWEETVDKMTKVYGAQIDPQQRQAIIGYLVTIHGPDAATRQTPPPEDDFDSITAAKPPARPDTSPLLALAADTTARAAEVKRGGELFQQNCAACHGNNGRGDGMVGEVLLRKPKNLTAIRFPLRLLSQVLWNGKPGTAMPSWRGLTPQDLAALAAYVQTLHPSSQADPVVPATLQRGNLVFQQNCAPCHGAAGDGKGTAAANLLPQPANFKLKQPDLDYILQVLRDGIQGTAMPSWQAQISEADRRALAGFVRSLFMPTDPP